MAVEVKFREGSRSPQVIIRDREAPGVLSRSADPTKRMREDHFVDGNPLRHRSAVYDGGMQGTFRTIHPPINWGK